MAARPTSRVATTLINRSVRHLHMTGPATFPSAILTETRSNAAEYNFDSIKRPSTASSSSTTDVASTRQFNTSRVMKAVGDSSTIDFAYFPEQEQVVAEQQARIPLLLNTMYTGATARAMHEETPEVTLGPLINLTAGSSTHFAAPSALSDVSDNNAVPFEGISHESSSKEAEESKTTETGAFKQLWNELFQ